MPKCKPEIVDVPPMNYIAVRGKGDPNEEGLCVQMMHRELMTMSRKRLQ